METVIVGLLGVGAIFYLVRRIINVVRSGDSGTVAQTYFDVAAPFMGLVRAEPAVARP